MLRSLHRFRTSPWRAHGEFVSIRPEKDRTNAGLRRVLSATPFFFPAAPIKLATGKLLTIDNQIDQTTGTAKLKAVFDNKDNQLWPNQFVNANLLLETRRNSTVLPTAAILRGPQGAFVYAVKNDKTVEARPVTVTLAQGNMTVVTNGVAPGDVVVTDGQDKLQTGSSIEPRDAGSTNTPSASSTGSAPISGIPAS